jgi:hypothetical protein
MKSKHHLLCASIALGIIIQQPAFAKWVHFGNAPNGGDTFIDDQSIIINKNGIIELWMKQIFKNPVKEKAIGNFFFNLTDTHFLINCDNRSIAFSSVIFYNKEGKTVYKLETDRDKLKFSEAPSPFKVL